MDRIVTAVDYGDCKMVVGGEIDFIFYLYLSWRRGIFGYRYAQRAGRFCLDRWCATSHCRRYSAITSEGVCHNDIKPANVLSFNRELQN